MVARKPLDLQPGDKVKIELAYKFMYVNRRQYFFNEWRPYLKEHNLTLVFEKATYDSDYFTVQKVEDTQIQYVC